MTDNTCAAIEKGTSSAQCSTEPAKHFRLTLQESPAKRRVFYAVGREQVFSATQLATKVHRLLKAMSNAADNKCMRNATTMPTKTVKLSELHKLAPSQLRVAEGCARPSSFIALDNGLPITIIVTDDATGKQATDTVVAHAVAHILIDLLHKHR